jgi:hypothetical protein
LPIGAYLFGNLKIAGIFIEDMATDAMDHAIVDAINRISHILGMRTVAESVEDAVTLEKIKALNIDYAQGYFIAKPEALLHERPRVNVAHLGQAQTAQQRIAAAAALPRRLQSGSNRCARRAASASEQLTGDSGRGTMDVKATLEDQRGDFKGQPGVRKDRPRRGSWAGLRSF